VIDGDDAFWIIGDKRLSKIATDNLQKKIDDKYFNHKLDNQVYRNHQKYNSCFPTSLF
tara:strand:+ start:145 stop:318 length:174 start_codon:yes stop_codon:yes gene_type:complete